MRATKTLFLLFALVLLGTGRALAQRASTMAQEPLQCNEVCVQFCALDDPNCEGPGHGFGCIWVGGGAGEGAGCRAATGYCHISPDCIGTIVYYQEGGIWLADEDRCKRPEERYSGGQMTDLSET